MITSRMFIVSVPIICSLGFGCSSEAPEPVNTVSYYREHPEERKSMMTRCADDPGSVGRTANCVNAKQATAVEDIGSFKDLPPMNLGGKKKDAAGSTDAPAGDGKPESP